MADMTPTSYRDTMEGEGYDLKEMLRTHRTQGLASWQPKWEKATQMQKFCNGEHWGEADKNKMDKAPSKSPRLSVREIDPVLQTFSGRQMMQRFERAYMPRHSAAARKGEIMTAIDRAMMHAADAEQIDSSAFKDGPGIQGISCVRWEMDDLNERGGGILISDVPIWQVMADPEARRVNLSDRGWQRFGSWWPVAEVKERWPEHWQTLLQHVGSGSWIPTEPKESSRIPWTGMAGNKTLDYSLLFYPKGRAVWIEYEEWKEIVPEWEVVIPADPSLSYADAIASAVENGPDIFSSVVYRSLAEVREFKERHLATFGEDVPKSYIARKRSVKYKFAYICGDTVLETDDIPTEYWTFQFLTGFRIAMPTCVEWSSVVERLVDPQKWVDVMLSALVRNLQITPKGLLFAEEGFFRNRQEAMSAWSNPGGLIMVGRGKLSGGNPGFLQVNPGTQTYAGMVESLMSFAQNAIPRLAGFNPGALGQLGGDLRRISGEVVRQVQDAAMASNAEPFDALRHYRREGGRIFLSFLRRFFEPDQLVEIVGEETAYEDVIDPMTKQPVVDPVTGEPQRRLVIADKESWHPAYWKEIGVEDVVPTGDQLASLWKAVETSIQILLQPQPDTGMPLFSSEDLAEIIPGIPAQRRERMLQRIRAAVLAMQQQPPTPPTPPGAEGQGGPPSPAQPPPPPAMAVQ